MIKMSTVHHTIIYFYNIMQPINYHSKATCNPHMTI